MRTLTPIFLVAITFSPCWAAVSIPSMDELAPVYRWEDTAGRLHFSNRGEHVPSFATRLELAPVAMEEAQEERSGSVPEVASSARPPARPAGECEPGDATGVTSAVASRLTRKRQIEGLTLLLASVPVTQGAGTVTTRVVPGGRAEDHFSAADQGAIAYPAGSSCPTRPPLPRYAVGAGPRTTSDGLCDDYRRAFAEVGVAVSRNHGVADSFRRIARDFAVASAHGYVVGGNGSGMSLPGWIVEAHVAQAEEIAAETADFVSELTVALEEIDHAARVRGCW